MSREQCAIHLGLFYHIAKQRQLLISHCSLYIEINAIFERSLTNTITFEETTRQPQPCDRQPE